ncbi:MAG: capsule assembly Wzi family protein [Chitinivibrionales bacterium]
MIRGLILTAFITVFASVVTASPVQGMESLFYDDLFHLDELESSGSGMFWDDMYTDSGFNTLFIPDSGVLGKDRWSLYPWLSGGLSSSRYITDKNIFGAVGLTNDIKFRRLFIRQTLDVDTRYKNDTDYVWKKDRVAAGRIEEAYLHLDLPHSFIRFGRLNRNWGPFYNRSLILSSNTRTYDALEWKLESSFFEFRQMFSYFSYARDSHAAIDPSPANRYLTAHSLNFMIQDWAVLGITETVLFNREGLPDFQYVNPFTIYTVTNTNTEGKGNLMLGLNWSIKPPFYKKLSFKGEVVFDDFQVDDEDAGDQEPTHWGIDMGLYAHDFLPVDIRHALYTEYKYLSRWIYTVDNRNTRAGERYTYLGRSMGAADNDYDRFLVGLDIAGSDFWTASAGFSYRREGGNTVMTPWNDDGGGSLGYREETPLSDRDTLTRKIDLFFEGKFYFRKYIGFHARFDNVWERDRGESWSYSPEIGVSLSTRYGFDLLFERFSQGAQGD